MKKSFGVRRQAGFSMIELLLVIAIIAIMSGIAVISARYLLPEMRANQAAYQVAGSMREARMLAMSGNINVCMEFPADDRIRIGIWNINAGVSSCDDITATATLPAWVLDPSVTLEHGHVFLWNDSLTEAEPGLGAGSSIIFGGTAVTPGDTPLKRRFVFTADGFLTEYFDLNNPINGTIYIGHPNSELARAVTILGATGRIHSLRWKNGAWLPVG